MCELKFGFTTGLTTMLSMSVIVMVVGDTMPKTSNTQPLISCDLVDNWQKESIFVAAMYIMGEMMLSAVASASTVFIMVLSRQANYGVRPPMWLKR
jgi:xanthine/uracil/vitamin C permease (AzgA family)